MKNILTVKNLSISFEQYGTRYEKITTNPIKDISFALKKGEILGVIGESGSGKTLLAQAIFKILPDNASISGDISYNNKSILNTDIKNILREKIRYIPQSVSFFDPVKKIGKQLEESYAYLNKKERRKKVIEALEMFSLDSSVYDKYPFELSGGMLRRVFLAEIKSGDYDLIIADEPTPGIDEKILREVLDFLLLLKERGKSILFISHDMENAVNISDRILAFKDGKVLANELSENIKSGNLDKSSYIYKLWMAQAVNGMVYCG